MHDNKTKIYSRPRIRIQKIRLNKKRNMHIENKNKEKIAKIFFILIIAITTVKLILDSVMPVFDSLCEEKAKSIATIISNEQSTEVMKDHTYDELFTIEKDNNGNIIMIKSNIVKINEIISEIPNKIHEEINKRGKENIKIALGSFTGIRILSGIGPRSKNSNIFNRKCRYRFKKWIYSTRNKSNFTQSISTNKMWSRNTNTIQNNITIYKQSSTITRKRNCWACT